MEFFNYNEFFNNIDKYNRSQITRIIKKETNNFDVFLIVDFFHIFIDFIVSHNERIKFKDIDITFSDEKYKHLGEYYIVEDYSLLTYNHYSTNLGIISKKRIFIEFDLIEPMELGYYAELFGFLISLEGFIYKYAKPENLKVENIEVTETIDFSATTATEKIIYLQKLGVLDFLKNKQPFILSTNSLATVLSAITGEKAGTLQPMLNPIFSKQVDTKNNPLNSLKAVKKVETQLINIGFNVNETN